jgi:ABC-type uncharacterized transport system involved in gliding motility auxiliary subunit
MKRFLGGGAALVLLVVLFFAINILAETALTGYRLDLTQGGLYTLSDGTRQTLARIREPITLHFFYSKKLADDYPQIRSYADRVQEVLLEYVAASHGKLQLRVQDPEPYTETEDKAVDMGLKGAQTDSGDRLYFGLVGTNSVGERETITYFVQDREPFLEYDITRLIYRLTGPKKPVVAILTSLPLENGAGGVGALLQGNAQPYMIYELMRKDFDVRLVGPKLDTVDPAVDVLLLAHPPALDPATLYAIDQFALRGGRILAFVDPYFEGARGSGLLGQEGIPDKSDLGPLLKAWGVAYDPTKVVGDRVLAQRASTTVEGRSQVIAFPPWLGVTKDNIDHDDPVTADIGTLNLASAGSLAPIRGATTSLTPLARSTDQAELIDTTELRGTPDPFDLLSRFRATGERYVLAARLSGAAHTAFPDGPPTPPAKPSADESGAPEKPADEKADSDKAKSEPKAGEAKDDAAKPGDAAPKGPARLVESKAGINVVLVADADMLRDQWWMQPTDVLGQRVAVPTADNANFVLDALDNLSGSDALIALRGRGRIDRPFTVIQDLQRRAETRFLAEAQGLQHRVTAIQDQLRSLHRGAPADAAGVTPQEAQASKRFETELLRTRTALRKVQLNLRRDVDRLEAWIRFVNFGLVPILVAVAAIAVALVRRRRRSARVRAFRA